MAETLRSKSSSNRVGIIGAGPAGLAAAHALTKEEFEIDVFEAAATVGGMARSFRLWDQTVDLGPHRFFSTDARVNRLWLEVLNTDYRMVERLTRIYYRGKLFQYPLQPFDALGKLGPGESILCLSSYLRELLRRPRSQPNFEDWVSRRFGRRLYEIFFRSYSEKLWGIPCKRLEADFAAQRIRGFSAWEAFRNVMPWKKNNVHHATLVDRFAYPLGGTGSVYDRMANSVIARGGSVLLESPVKRVALLEDESFELELVSGARHTCRHLVSTMPLTGLVRILPNVPGSVLEAAGALSFRNTILVYLRLEAGDLFPDQWIYINDSELEVGRITNFRNWVPELCESSPDSILSLEMWCDPDDEKWRLADKDHIDRASHELRQTGLIGDARILNGHVVRVPNCYPVYERGYRVKIDILQQYLGTVQGLQVIGRGGSFRYNNQDHSLLMGLLAAENISRGAAHDLWNVNTGEKYQEAAMIDDTGLVPATF